MMAALHVFLFLLDAGLVAGSAWLLVREFAAELTDASEMLLAWGIGVVAAIAGAGVLLGAVGALHGGGFLGVHAAAGICLVAARRRLLGADAAAARALIERICAQFRPPGSGAILPGVLAVAVVLFLGLAAISPPVVYDALSYRLPRIGQWLQDNRISIIDTDDARLNYMPVVPDLVMAWLLTASRSGFQLAALAQAGGGILTLLATLRLARATGLNRNAALGAGCLLLGLPNVVPQFTSLYTDLFTTGIVAAGFCLWFAALERTRGSWFGGLAVGLALGAKGTVVYLMPGLAIVVMWLAWQRRTPAREWLRTLLGALVATAIFVGPTAWRNLRAYGHPVASREYIVWHEGEIRSGREALSKLGLNLASSAAELCEPNSQPPWFRPAARAFGAAVIRRLPEADAFAFDHINRRANLDIIYSAAVVDADTASTGILLPCLCVMGWLLAWSRRASRDARLILAWSLLVLAFVLVLHGRLQWHPFLFRFVVLVAPWLAVIAAWTLQSLPRRLRFAGWIVAGATTVHGFIAGNFETYQAGWPAWAKTGQSFGYHIYQRWRAFADELEPAAGPLRPHLPVNQLSAAFYRRAAAQSVKPGRLSQLGTDHSRAEDHVKPGDGWLIVPAASFIGREGDVVTNIALFDGDEKNSASLAAYRALRPGENPPPVIYRNRIKRDKGRPARELLVRSWSETPLRLELVNPRGAPLEFEIRGPLGSSKGKIEARGRREVEIRIPANFPTLLTIESDTGGANDALPPVVRAVR